MNRAIRTDHHPASAVSLENTFHFRLNGLGCPLQHISLVVETAQDRSPEDSLALAQADVVVLDGPVHNVSRIIRKPFHMCAELILRFPADMEHIVLILSFLCDMQDLQIERLDELLPFRFLKSALLTELCGIIDSVCPGIQEAFRPFLQSIGKNPNAIPYRIRIRSGILHQHIIAKGHGSRLEGAEHCLKDQHVLPGLPANPLNNALHFPEGLRVRPVNLNVPPILRTRDGSLHRICIILHDLDHIHVRFTEQAKMCIDHLLHGIFRFVVKPETGRNLVRRLIAEYRKHPLFFVHFAEPPFYCYCTDRAERRISVNLM